MGEPGIKISPSVRAATSQLRSRKIHAYELVENIIDSHKEYASGTAREVSGMGWPDFGQEQRMSAKDWVDRLIAIFDPQLAGQLHGRLAILGLCHLDKTLGRHLRSFTAELRRELTEDFESLLLPDEAGKQKYRRGFLRILQNRSRQITDSDFDLRSNGFVILTRGGIGLEVLAGLCFKQKWNRCLTARYQVTGNAGFANFLQNLITDLRGLDAHDHGTIGRFLPELGGTRLPQGQATRGSRSRGGSTWQGWIERAGKKPIEPNPGDQSGEIKLHALSDVALETLKTGQRLVFFVEWRGIATDADAESIGLTDGIISKLQSLPERMGIVISGMPEAIRNRVVSDPGYQLELPEEEEPRRGQRLLNDTPIGPDRLNIQDDVEALADAIALKEMSPPIVVGIFGGWGSGKSFVMHLIEQRLQERRCEGIGEGNEARQNYPFVGHPYLVHFDAWTYAKGNLWASLMQTILVELDRQISLERKLADDLKIDLRDASPVWKILWQLTDKQRQILTKTELGKNALASVKDFAHSGSPGELWSELSRLRKTELDKLDAETGILDNLRAQHAEARRALEATIDTELTGEAQKIAWMPVWEELGGLVENGLGKQNIKNFDQLSKAIPVMTKLWIGFKNLSMPAAIFMVVAIAGGWLIAEVEGINNIFAKLSGSLVAIATPVLRAWEWFEQRRSAYERRVAVMMDNKDKLRQQRIDEQINLATENSPGKLVAQLDTQIADRQATIRAIRARVGITGQARSLNDFLKTRIEEGLYQKELGLLDQIQNDIQELSDTLLPVHAAGALDRATTDKLFPRGDPRVVLFIDDLDRCPPDKVVEVLEAAQLLVKTQLFVVVIAIDVRYVTRALENEYKGVLVRSGEPSGLDYIEKIIQIPYRVRPVSAKGIERFLSSQMDVLELDSGGGADEDQDEDQNLVDPDSEDSAAQQATRAKLAESAQTRFTESIVLPPRALEFEPEEYVAINQACRAVPVSPRTMKRLVNVFKLLKIIWYRQGLDTGPMIEVKKTMLSILALCSRYPEVMRKLLSEMDAFYRDDINDLSQNLAAYLSDRCLEGIKVALYPPDWEQVIETIEHNFPEKVSFGLLKEANLHLLISFSFVGETDSEREATLRRGFYRNTGSNNADETGESDPPDVTDASAETGDDAPDPPG